MDIRNHVLKCSLNTVCWREAESEKDGQPRNQVPEEGFDSEEVWQEILQQMSSQSSFLS